MDTWKNGDVPHRGNIRIDPAYYIPPHQVVLFSGVQFRVAGHIIITWSRTVPRLCRQSQVGIILGPAGMHMPIAKLSNYPVNYRNILATLYTTGSPTPGSSKMSRLLRMRKSPRWKARSMLLFSYSLLIDLRIYEAPTLPLKSGRYTM